MTDARVNCAAITAVDALNRRITTTPHGRMPCKVQVTAARFATASFEWPLMFSTAARVTLLACCIGLFSASAATAQDLDFGGWSFDPGMLVAGGEDVMRRAPDRDIDMFFQAVHAASQTPGEASAMCALFDPDADRSLTGLNAAMTQFGPASRERFANALAGMLVAASQNQPQPYDEAVAQQALKAAGVSAAILNDGFVGGLNAEGNDAASRQARCQSLRWLLDAAQQRPLSERAAMTRLLLSEGLQRLPAVR